MNCTPITCRECCIQKDAYFYCATEDECKPPQSNILILIIIIFILVSLLSIIGRTFWKLKLIYKRN